MLHLNMSSNKDPEEQGSNEELEEQEWNEMMNQKNMNQMTVATEICANVAIENLEKMPKVWTLLKKKFETKIVLCFSSTNWKAGTL